MISIVSPRLHRERTASPSLWLFHEGEYTQIIGRVHQQFAQYARTRHQ